LPTAIWKLRARESKVVAASQSLSPFIAALRLILGKTATTALSGIAMRIWVVRVLIMSSVLLCVEAYGSDTCLATSPNGDPPPGQQADPNSYGNGALWTDLWPSGTVVFRPGGPGFQLQDGSLQMKFPWWRAVRGALSITGRRLDGDAPPLRAHIPSGYGDTGFQATSLVFPTPGCWEVTGKAGNASLTFITRVVHLQQ
jgi:hypothetical protein